MKSHLVIIAAALTGVTGSALAQSGAYINQIDPRTAMTRQPGTASAAFVDDGITPSFAGSSSPSAAGPGSNTGLTTSGSLTAAQANNLAVLSQIGLGNTGDINQTGSNNTAAASLAGNANATNQTQSGSGNVSLIGAVGNANATLATNQSGNGNSALFGTIGTGNSLNVTQSGSNLSFGLSVIGNGKTITVTQQGVGTGPAVTGVTGPAAGIIPSVRGK